MLFRQIVLPLASSAIDHRNRVGLGPAPDSPAESASQAHQMGVVYSSLNPSAMDSNVKEQALKCNFCLLASLTPDFYGPEEATFSRRSPRKSLFAVI